MAALAAILVTTSAWVGLASSSSGASTLTAGQSTLAAAIGGPGPRSGMPWTSGVNGETMTAANVDEFGSLRGRPVDVAVVSVDRTQGFDHMVDPGWIINSFQGWTGRLVIGLAPWAENGGSYSQCAGGAYDAGYTSFTRRLAQAGRSGTVVRFAWEFNGYMYWRATDTQNFINCYRRAAAALRAGDANVIIDLTLNGDHTPSDVCGGNAQNCYPGDQYVDIIGIDFYDQWEPKKDTASWNAEVNAEAGLNWVYQWAKSRGKKFSTTEWSIVNPSAAKAQRDGPQHFGYDNPFFVTQMMSFFRSHAADLAYEAYFTTQDREDVGSDLFRGLASVNRNSAAEYKRQVAQTAPPPPPPPGAVLIRGVGSNRCLTPPASDGADATIQDCASQRWAVTSGGPITINGKCLVALGTANFTKVSVGTCNGGNNQKWTPLADGSIRGTESNRCVDVFNHGTANGTKIQLWDCTGESHQRWTLQS